MPHSTRGCRPEELDALNVLVNSIFRGPRPGDMRAEYPLLFNPDNSDRLRVVAQDGQLVAHVGVCIRDACILGARIRVTSIGAVGTLPEVRGQGMASDLMDDAAALSRADGVNLMLISGGRGLYHRLGYVTVGRFAAYRAASGTAPSGPEIDVMREEDLDAVIALHQREPVRFYRPREDWDAVLAAGMLMNQAADLLVVRAGGQAVAYLATQRPARGRDGQLGPARVQEFAGAREAVAAVLPAVAARYEVPESTLIALPDDAAWEAAARRHAYSHSPVTFAGTLGIIDPPAFFGAIRPYLDERLGRDLGGVRIEPCGEGARFRIGDESLLLSTMGELTAFVFGGDTEEARRVPPVPTKLGAALSRAFPMPLLWYGYNYV